MGLEKGLEIRKNQYSHKSIRLENSLILKIQNIANEKQMSFNAVVSQCLEWSLKHIKD